MDEILEYLREVLRVHSYSINNNDRAGPNRKLYLHLIYEPGLKI